jgi:hypothetical protein
LLIHPNFIITTLLESVVERNPLVDYYPPYTNEQLKLRARPLTLHLHFYIRNADADAGKCPTQPGIPQMWMKKIPGGAELPTFPRFMQGACYQLKANNFRKVVEIMG